MFFIFGTNNFHLNSYSFRELNLPIMDEKRKYTIDIIEVYFHVFYIPIFSLGKHVKMARHGDYFDVPDYIDRALDRDLLKSTSKWYSFTGIYILLLGYLSILGMNELDRREELRLKEEHQQNVSVFLAHPQIGDRYYFQSNQWSVQGEVHAITKDSICFTFDFPSEKNNVMPPDLSKEEQLQFIIQFTERRNYLTDSLRESFPNELILRDQLALQDLGKIDSIIQFSCSRLDVKHALCFAKVCKRPQQKLFGTYNSEAVYLIEIERQKSMK